MKFDIQNKPLLMFLLQPAQAIEDHLRVCSREIRISGRYWFLVCRCEGIKTFSTKLWYLNTLNRNWLSGRITWKNLDIYVGLDQNIGTVAPHYHSGWFYIFYVVTFRKIWQNSLWGNNINSTNPYKKMS